ncbi:DUF397 domain-containing protein [Salinactinospora qingdaonensis]|uniref:DUF397 domain-containing protein n=1 Tax=Salinactinospora qingdaonensis TaxID=702744 RepID=A0ABP7FDB8_9ACTN
MEMWVKSSYSQGNGGNCVEIYKTPEAVKIRDTQTRHLGHLTMSAAEWAAFLAEVRTDRL